LCFLKTIADAYTKVNELTFLIIGAGRFGSRAVERLRKKNPQARFTVIDENPEALEHLSHLPGEKICHEGASYLAEHLFTDVLPDWIIPAVPIHLAFEWLRLKILDERLVEVIAVPWEIEAVLPNPVRGKGRLLVSYADFICPDKCTEPFDLCTFTGKPRKGLLYKQLEEVVNEDFTSVVIRSNQLAPGVGGYRPEALEEALSRVLECNGPVLFSTACFCHGVVHAFRLSQARQIQEPDRNPA
jgi:hypothetical protein